MSDVTRQRISQAKKGVTLSAGQCGQNASLAVWVLQCGVPFTQPAPMPSTSQEHKQ